MIECSIVGSGKINYATFYVSLKGTIRVKKWQPFI